MGFFDAVGQNLYSALIVENRYVLILSGLKNTLIITLFSAFFGILIGLVIAIIKVTYANTGKLRVLNAICGLYLTVIRGTPVMVQLIIINGTLLFFGGLLIPIVAFSINSGAYVAEIIRAGIMSVDRGQTEAGFSLGLTYRMTMKEVVLPQALKNILPALGNEFITLLKETSIAGYVAIRDLTKAADNIFTRTFNLTPVFIAAGIYLLLVMVLTSLLSALERRLRKSDHR